MELSEYIFDKMEYVLYSMNDCENGIGNVIGEFTPKRNDYMHEGMLCR